MPEISRFYGIVIRMWPDDHPYPHFHAWFGGSEVSVRIADGKVTGRFPLHKLKLVRRWLNQHRTELSENWALMEQNGTPRYIDPLE